ncbi:cobalamin biosynthesis protein CbiL [Martelella radicis]|uniref:Nickel transport protein n=1 Tax=Martelella radicis TaxID=1397476 RepID=A0A7W6P977_9HYPH|nr:cobalamin biosynthesis protein CbiL [Martelella radicis]MBB4120249.1 nickel transport protein [Martelella radicis]
MRYCLALLLAMFVSAHPALAHSLRVFATVEGREIVGYGFFVGGGRPQGAAWTAAMSGNAFAGGKTDQEGGFAFAAPDPVTGPVTVTIDTGEGHVASRALTTDRFGAVTLPVAQSSPAEKEASAVRPGEGAAITTDMVRTAVAQEVAPLLERIEQMDARMRLTDIVAGLSLIFGIAGIALWARGRRR